MSIQSGTSPGAIVSAGTSPAPPGAVDSVFGRTGDVVAVSGDYDSDQVDNASSVSGTSVSDALETLAASIPAVPVSSVFGRTGAVISAAGDYAASQVNNDSNVAGAHVSDALNNLHVDLIVANVAAFAAIDDTLLQDHTRARVTTFLDDFDLLKTSTLTFQTNVIIATQSGTGRWVRRLQPNLVWQSQTDWAIDPLLGNDENTGTIASPLASGPELARRWGTWGTIANNTILQIVSSLPLDNPLRIQINLPLAPNGATATRFVIKGIRTQAATGALTGYTPLSRTTGATTRNTITATFDFTSHVNKTIRLTSGTGLGYAAQIQIGGVNSATITPWTLEVTSDTAVPASAPLLQPAGIISGDSFEILDCPSLGGCYLISLAGGGGMNGATTSTSSAVQIKNIKAPTNVASSTSINTPNIQSLSPAIPIYVLSCDLGSNNLGCGLIRCQNTLISAGILCSNGLVSASTRFTSGGTKVGGTALIITAGGVAMFDGDFAFTVVLGVGDGSSVASLWPAFARLGNVGFFIPAGLDVVRIDASGFIQCRVGDYVTSIVYGSSTGAGYGIRVISGGKMNYVTKPTINAGLGVGRETIVGGTDTLYAAIPFVNIANLAMIAVEA